MLRDLLQDLRYGARSLRRSPGFTTLVVLTLALGISANVAIFTLIEVVFVRPLPVPDPGALVFFSDRDGSRGSGPLGAMRLPVSSYPLYTQLQADSPKVWSQLAAYQSGHTTSVVSRSDGNGEAFADAAGKAVTANYFDTFGVRALLGRTFGADDQTAPGANPVVVLGHRFWKRRFAGDPTLVGSRLGINGTAYTVIGVAPPEFFGASVGSTVDFWVPLTMQAQLMRPKTEGVKDFRSWLDRPEQWWLVVFGRLAPGVSLTAAEASANVVLQQFLAQNPAVMRADAKPASVRLGLVPGARGVASIREALQGPLTMLMAAVGLLLLIVCLNVSHLLLVRANRRHREMSIRTALGASRFRLVRQVLSEGLLLSALGAGLASLIAPWLTAGLVAFDPDPEGVFLDVNLNGRLLGFSAALAVATALLTGLVPAWQATRANLAQSLRATAASVTASRSRRLASRILLTSQVAFSLVLMVGAGLLASSLARLRTADKGFDEEHLLLVRINARLGGLDEGRARALPDTLLARLSALPGVSGVSASSYGLFSGDSWRRGLSYGRATPTAQQVSMNTNGVTAGYFDAVGMRLLRGRGFTGDERENTRAVVVLNEAAARKMFGRQDALGRYLHEHGRIAKDMEVVGIVRDARTQGLTREPPPMYYVPLSQQDDFAGALEVRAAGDPGLLAADVLRALRETAPGLGVISVRTMKAQLERALTGERILATLSMVFGLAALFLVSLGLYGVITQWAAQRTQEIGVRMALGATAARVRWMVLRQAFLLVGLGVAVGLPAAVAASTLIKGALHGVRPMHPQTLIGAAVIMFAVAAIAAYLPARRASRVQPMAALRSE